MLTEAIFNQGMSKIQNLFTEDEINAFTNWMTTYFYQYFNIFEQCMTKFVDINVISKNFFPKPLPKVTSVDKGLDVHPGEYPVLEDYVPQDEMMKEELEEEY